jgi:SAM-dependent methyltransferase
MSAVASCVVCGARLTFLFPGGEDERAPSLFAPSFHQIGAHGDLYRCVACHAVQQPSLPRGAELHSIYRRMSDKAYLSEEAGRRHMARLLLEKLGRHVAPGHLLEVGCGHGLLLDEAVKQGYQAEGLELSHDAARYARQTLGLQVFEAPLEEVQLMTASYDAVVMIDVLEHVHDPVATLDRLCNLLAPGGVLLIATPDPTSLVARIAGKRWWCYIPAHFCLIPRATLHDLLHNRNLVIVDDSPFVSSFTLRYWFLSFAERAGRMGRAMAIFSSLLPSRLRLTAPLHDQRVLLARRSIHAHSSGVLW